MFKKYTDLALESHEINLESGKNDGLIFNDFLYGDVKITKMRSSGDSNTANGNYYNIDIGRIWEMTSDMRRTRAEAIAHVLRELIPDGEGCILVSGIGNRNITPDSIGPLTADKIIVTRHLKRLGNSLYNEIGFAEMSTVAPGVLGQTGIESSEIISCIAKHIKPRAIIAVDALASRRLSRLCTTVQISDTGISPGSGVENNCKVITQGTTGVPVIAIGLPTVVDAATLAGDLFEELLLRTGTSCDDECEEVLGQLSKGSGGGMYVSLKESDVIIKEASRLIADGINLAVHKNIPYSDINEYRTQ